MPTSTPSRSSGTGSARSSSWRRFQSANIVGPSGVPARYDGARITANTFRLLRIGPALGRDLRDDDSAPGAAPVVIIGDTVWQEQFGGSPEAIGQALRVNGTIMTVVGVMPPKFRFPGNHDIWPALIVDPPGTKFGEGQSSRPSDGCARVSRWMKPAPKWRSSGVNSSKPIRIATPEDTVEVKTYIEEFIGSEPLAMLLTMLTAVFGVLLIACVNVANLLLARAAPARGRWPSARRLAPPAGRWCDR